MSMRRAFLLLILAIGAPGIAGTALANDPNRAKAKVLFEEGMKQYNLGNLQEALNAFKDGYLVRPDPVFLFNIAQCYRMLGNHEKAVYSYQRFLGASPDAPNRSEVEALVQKEEASILRKDAALAPTGPLPPPEESKPVPVAVKPAAAVTAVPAQPPRLESKPAPAAPPPARQVQKEPPRLAPLPPPVKMVAAAPITQDPAPAKSTPVYKKWWLWTIVGVAVAGAGAGIGAAYAMPKDAAVPATDAVTFPVSF